jgi:DNA-directed RNA polymerase subunit RPC12/RpoP
MKFTQHDIVLYRGNRAKVLTGWHSISGKPKYRIEILDGAAKGMSLEVAEDRLEKGNDLWDAEDKSNYILGVDTEKRCPSCGSNWVVTRFNGKVWYDCTYCKKTKEEIMKQYPPKFNHHPWED